LLHPGHLASSMPVFKLRLKNLTSGSFAAQRGKFTNSL
jgi:hypothetical protein